MSVDASRSEGLGVGLVGVTVAGLLGNGLAYILLLVGARALAPAAFSELVTILNVLLAAYVPTLALQMVVARRWTIGDPHSTFASASIIAIGGGLVLAALTPALGSFLHLRHEGLVLLAAIVVPGAAIQGWCQGVCQGEERFRALALTTLAGQTGRSLAGILGLLVTKSAVGTMLALAIGTLVAAAGCAYWLRREVAASSGHAALRDVLLESAHAAHGYGAFMLLSAIDLLLARHLLAEHTSAVYAAGSVLTRIALWLPQSVASVLFASLTKPEGHRSVYLRAVAALSVLGLVEIAGTWVLKSLVVTIVGGGKYPELSSDIWLFAMLGAMLSVIQFSLAAGLATRSIQFVAVLWLTVAGDVVALLTRHHLHTVRGVASTVVLVTVVGMVVGVAVRTRAATYFSGAGQAGAM